MATLRTIKGNKYSRVRWWAGFGYKEKTFSLNTKDDAVADYRNGIVETKEYLIKQDVEFQFEWENDEGITKQKKYTLHDATEEYLQHLHLNGRKPSTIQNKRDSFKYLFAVLGESFPVKSLDNNCIKKIIKRYKGQLSDNGINMNLERIRTLCNWLYDDKEILKKKIKINKIKVAPKEPAYLNQQNIEDIMALDWLDNHYKDAFRFYMETGCRLSEPLNSHIKNGDWLIITVTKNGRIKKVKLQPHHISVIEEIYSRLKKSRATLRTFGKRYSEKFKKVARAIGREDLHFHNLRDTFAVIRYYETRDIYQVCSELCHSSVTITEKYANFFSFEELEDDFRALKDGGSFIDFMRKVHTQSDKSSIPPMVGVGSGWGNQSMGNYKYSLVRK